MKCDISAIVADARQRRATQLFTGGPDAHTLGLADAVVPHEYIAVTIRVVWDQIRRVGRERHESPVCAQDRFKAFAICLIAALSTLARTIHLQPEVTSISDSANTKTRPVAMVAPCRRRPDRRAPTRYGQPRVRRVPCSAHIVPEPSAHRLPCEQHRTR